MRHRVTDELASIDDIHPFVYGCLKQGAQMRAYGVEEWAREDDLREDHLRDARDAYERGSRPQYTLRDVTDDDIPNSWDDPSNYVERVCAVAEYLADTYGEESVEEYLASRGVEGTAADILDE